MERRKFVKMGGVVSAGVLTAGCVGGDETEATEVADVTETTGATDTGAEADGTETTTGADDDQIDVFTNNLQEEEDVDQIAPGETGNFDVRFTDIDMQNVGYYVVSVDSDIV